MGEKDGAALDDEVGVALQDIDGETLGIEDGLRDGSMDDASVEFTVGSEVITEDGIQEGKYDSVSLEI